MGGGVPLKLTLAQHSPSLVSIIGANILKVLGPDFPNLIKLGYGCSLLSTDVLLPILNYDPIFRKIYF